MKGNFSREFIPFGKILKPFKNKGEVKVKFYNEKSPLIKEGLCLKVQNLNLEIEEVRKQNKVYVVKFKGINSRFAAEALANIEVELDTSYLPELPDNEYYVFELEGMEVITPEGEKIGTVINAFDRGITVIEVKEPSGELFEIPLTDDFFVDLDKVNRKIIVNKPEFDTVFE